MLELDWGLPGLGAQHKQLSKEACRQVRHNSLKVGARYRHALLTVLTECPSKANWGMWSLHKPPTARWLCTSVLALGPDPPRKYHCTETLNLKPPVFCMGTFFNVIFWASSGYATCFRVPWLMSRSAGQSSNC